MNTGRIPDLAAKLAALKALVAEMNATTRNIEWIMGGIAEMVPGVADEELLLCARIAELEHPELAPRGHNSRHLRVIE
ncbi:hypothetical protein amrb99_59250 [Actinomadura sp. RB99]|uniref:hypothetical protein n=1 Tax=Actinomadura sp. RB99 TaxID=2691577 RepID=UPI0016875702|nr:hypothetical protein [Actinomadura sp. RB99]MBD2896972.1 hypothetical protein [Actinomadura sp. RB99]